MSKANVSAIDLAKYWKSVTDNPDDFNAWTYLLAYTEHVNDIVEARKAFGSFLNKWPFCYGYWNRYADMEKRNANAEKARDVYESGIAATPLSIDLWLHYINFENVQREGKPEYEESIRRLYERAVVNVGMDFKSDKVWDGFINWEATRNPANALRLYEKLLSIPTQNISKQFENMKRFIHQHKPRDLIAAEELLVHLKSAIGVESMDTDESSEIMKLRIEQYMNGLTSDQLKTVRNLIALKRETAYQNTVAELEKRKHFEENIRRSYFHIKPLEPNQLQTWRDYTDFEISNGDHSRIVFLFERCIVACAMYEEFWMKYTTYLMKHDLEATSKVFEKACTIHLSKKPHIYLAWAAFEESRGNCIRATEIYNLLEQNVPGLAMTFIRRINMHRRMGEMETVKRLYSEAINSSSAAGATFYACKYARFLHFIMKDTAGARDVIEKQLEKQKSNARLYLLLLDLEVSVEVDREKRVVAILDRAIENMETIEDRVLFSQRKMEFLEDFGSNTASIFSSYESHQSLLSKAALESKFDGEPSSKRASEQSHGNENVQPKVK